MYTQPQNHIVFAAKINRDNQGHWEVSGRTIEHIRAETPASATARIALYTLEGYPSLSCSGDDVLVTVATVAKLPEELELIWTGILAAILELRNPAAP